MFGILLISVTMTSVTLILIHIIRNSKVSKYNVINCSVRTFNVAVIITLIEHVSETPTILTLMSVSITSVTPKSETQIYVALTS